jgi:hypothetical protein
MAHFWTEALSNRPRHSVAQHTLFVQLGVADSGLWFLFLCHQCLSLANLDARTGAKAMTGFTVHVFFFAYLMRKHPIDPSNIALK